MNIIKTIKKSFCKLTQIKSRVLKMVEKGSRAEWIIVLLSTMSFTGVCMSFYVDAKINEKEYPLMQRVSVIENTVVVNESIVDIVNRMDKRMSIIEMNQTQLGALISEFKELRKDITEIKVRLGKD
jgi:hypothetical protein